jgi:hypothetical protein
MAYLTGSINGFPDLLTALATACQTEGWSVSGGAFSKDGCTFNLTADASAISIVGAGAADSVCITSMPLAFFGFAPIAFPAIFHLFILPGEVYLVLNYNLEWFQWLAFGQSTVAGLTGTGGWYGASLCAYKSAPVWITDTSAASDSRGQPLALFWTDGECNYFVDSGLDGQGWWNGQSARAGVSIITLYPLLSNSPNVWNQEAILLPLRCYKRRAENKVSLTADLQHARIVRVNNYAPGQIITLGSDRWMVFPWYRKNTAAPDGASMGTPSNGGDHSGTLGWALRYDGP